MPELKRPLPLSAEDLEADRGKLEAQALARYQEFLRNNSERMEDILERYEDNRQMVSPRYSQWPAEVAKYYQNTLHQPTLSLNQIAPVIQNISGRQITNRFKPKINAPSTDIQDQGFADALNEATTKIRKNGGAGRAESLAFKSTHIGAYGVIKVEVDPYQRRPEHKWRRLPLSEVIMDTYTRESNKSDARGWGWGSWVDRQELEFRWPNLREKFQEMVDQGTGSGEFDFQDGTDVIVWTQIREGRWWRKNTREAFLAEFEWKRRIPLAEIDIPPEVYAQLQQQMGAELPMADDLEDDDLVMLGVLLAQHQQGVDGGAMQPTPGDAILPSRKLDYEQLGMLGAAYEQAYGASFENYFKLEEDCVYYALVVGDSVVEVGKRTEGFSFFCITCYLDEEADADCYYGSVDLMRDRQMWANRFLNTYIHLLAVGVKAQYAIDKSSMAQDEVDQLSTYAARGDTFLAIEDPGNKLHELKKNNTPDGMANAFEMIYSLIPQAVGMSDTSLGQMGDIRRAPFRLAEQQVEQALVSQAEPYDSLSEYRKAATRHIIKTVIQYFSVDDLKRIVGPELSQYVYEDKSLWAKALDWNIEIGEEPGTQSQAEVALQTLVQTQLYGILKQHDEAPPTEALAKLFTKAAGASFSNAWVSDLKMKEPQRLAQRLELAMGMEPGSLMATIQQMQQPATQAPETVPPS